MKPVPTLENYDRAECKDLSDNDDDDEEEDEESDSDGDTYVVDDSTDSDEDDSCVKRTKWENIRKRDPYPVKENLQLGLEEAFFLSYGFGCLIVKDASGGMSLSTMWRKFSQLNPNFVPRYAVYHNFRSKGWVPKSGIKYGVDFAVYKEGPLYYHSSYLVIVKEVSLSEAENLRDSEMNFNSLSCLSRVTEQCSKEVMICYVVKSEDMNSDDLRSPNCLSKLSIMEVIVRRWVPNEKRESS